MCTIANCVAGNPEYYLDRRVHSAESKGADRQLHQCFLGLFEFVSGHAQLSHGGLVCP
jgi:hypothetical protein